MACLLLTQRTPGLPGIGLYNCGCVLSRERSFKVEKLQSVALRGTQKDELHQNLSGILSVYSFVLCCALS